MAVTAVTPTRLVAGTPTTTLPTSGGQTATSTTDGWSIALGSRGTTEQLYVVLLDDGSGCTVTVYAGDRNPGPAQLAAKGDDTFAMAASETFYYAFEPGRHEQDNNTIQMASSDAGTKLLAFLMPIGIDGGSAIA